MKLLLLLLTFLSCSLLGMAQDTRDLGSVDIAGNKGYVLSASTKDGKFTYKIYDQKSPEVEVGSFSLVNNNSINFIELMKQVVVEKELATILEAELEKYYFYFSKQNIFQVENEEGGKAMEMVFNDSMTVYGYNHSYFAAIKKKDIFYLINEFFPYKVMEDDFISDPFGFDYKSLNPHKDTIIFDESFIAKVNKTSNIKPRALRYETLYKAINNQYYSAYSNQVYKKLENYQGQSAIDNITSEISILNETKGRLVNDNSTFYTEILRLENKIKEYENNINSYKARLPNSLENYELENLTYNTETLEEIEEINRLKNKIDNYHESLPIPRSDNVIIISANEENTLRNIMDKLKSINTKLESYSLSLSSIQNEKNNINHTNDTLTQKKEFLTNSKQEIESVNQLIINKNKDLDNLKSIKYKEVSKQLDQLIKTNKHQFSPVSIQLEINRGYLENIIVNGTASVFEHKTIIDKDPTKKLPIYHLKFINDFPIGISAKKDIERIGNYKLYARYENGMHFELKLGDLTSIITEQLELDRKDYSPKDLSYSFNLPDENKQVFKKADSKEILQVKVFTDFVGISDENPNGLIQLEIDKEIPLLTKRIQRPYVWIPFRWLVINQSNVGVFNFFKPQFIYSKIENNNKYLQVKSFTSGTGEDEVTEYGVSSLQLKQFEIFSIGADFNLFLYDIPNGKSTFLLNTGFRFGRTDLASNEEEPEVNDFPRSFTNTIQPSLEALWRINGDERFGIEFSYGLNWLLSDELFFTQKGNTDGYNDFSSFDASKENNGLQRFTLLAYLNVQKESTGRLFFRYRFNSELDDFKNNYAQLQLGYTTYLTRANK